MAASITIPSPISDDSPFAHPIFKMPDFNDLGFVSIHHGGIVVVVHTLDSGGRWQPWMLKLKVATRGLGHLKSGLPGG